MNRVVVGYALIGRHPIAKVAGQIGESTFPPKDRKTKRMPDESGRTRVRDTPYYSFSEWFEAPRVPVKGTYGLRVWFEGKLGCTKRAVEVDVRKAFPAVHFYDEKTGQRYTLKGEVIPPKAPKPPKPPTERKKRKPAAAIGPTARARSEHREGSELVPATAAQRAPDAELVALVKKLEEERHASPKSEPSCWRPSVGNGRSVWTWSRSFCAPRRCPNRQPRTTARRVCKRRRTGRWTNS
jgi:hypothetical protein